MPQPHFALASRLSIVARVAFRGDPSISASNADFALEKVSAWAWHPGEKINDFQIGKRVHREEIHLSRQDLISILKRPVSNWKRDRASELDVRAVFCNVTARALAMGEEM